MKITIKNSTLVKPASETPQCIVWNSNIDLVIPRIHTPSVYFYKPNGGSSDFFSCDHLKEALGRALVPFYPMAGRLKEADKGRIDIDCNNEGVLFVEACADGCISEYGDHFAPTWKMRQLIPHIDYSQDLSMYPLLILQVTFFKCGGVSLGVGVQHHVADGIAALHFLNFWADLARGIEVEAKPFFDRTLLKARDLPKPEFEHVEYQAPPPLIKVKDPKPNGHATQKMEPQTKKLKKEEHAEEHQRTLEEIAKREEEKKEEEDPQDNEVSISTDLFLFSKEQILSLKSRAASHASAEDRPFTSYEVLSAHVWRCTCLARDLQDSQVTKLYIATDGRSRLKPSLPSGYFGNVIFTATPMECVGHLVDAPLADAARNIRMTLHKMDDEYLRSAIDYLELKPNITSLARGAHTFRSPNLGITSWVRLPIYATDFGWGPPVSMGPAGVPFEGLAYLLPGPPGDTSLRLSIALSPNHMQRFRELIYHF